MMTMPRRPTHAVMDLLKRLWRASSGSAAVEFALILPVMLLFTFGTFEFGRYFWTQNALQYAVEQTARQSIVTPPSTCATSAANSALVTANLVGLSADSVTVTLESATNAGSGLATPPKSCNISATYHFDFLGYLGLSGFNSIVRGNVVGLAAFPCSAGTTC
jgi:Flp pilus assembly protein TadG